MGTVCQTRNTGLQCGCRGRRTLKQQGCHSFEVVDQVAPVSSSAAIGDVADQVDATLLVMSTEVRCWTQSAPRAVWMLENDVVAGQGTSLQRTVNALCNCPAYAVG